MQVEIKYHEWLEEWGKVDVSQWLNDILTTDPYSGGQLERLETEVDFLRSTLVNLITTCVDNNLILVEQIPFIVDQLCKIRRVTTQPQEKKHD